MDWEFWLLRRWVCGRGGFGVWDEQLKTIIYGMVNSKVLL